MLLLLAAVAVVQGPYDADPKHPWNELHQALFTWRPLTIRTTVPAGLESDPLYWPISTDPWTFSAPLLPALDRALASGDLKDPLKRAILQHDLWLFLDSLDGMPQGGGWSVAPEDATARAAARRRIARLMRRVALTGAEIRARPDNLAAAVSSGRVATAFDPDQPDRPFLPKDLLDPKGGWVLLGREDGAPAAELHVKHFRGRSAFLVYASLPDGREPTMQYIRSLSALNKTKMPERSPVGTRLLFVRRPLLLDRDGNLHLSPLVEEVRIRAEGKDGAAVFEFHLNRNDLFGGLGGGIRAAAQNEEGVLFFFNRGSSKQSIRASCAECHGNHVTPAAVARYGGRDPRTHEVLATGIPFRESTVEAESGTVMKWKQADKSWDTLRQFWPKE